MGIELVTVTQYTCDRCGYKEHGEHRARGGYAELDTKIDLGTCGSVGPVWLCGYCAEAFELFMANEEKVYRQD